MWQKWLNLLAGCPLFQGITRDELQVMLDCLKPAVNRYSSNEIIAVAGEPFTGLGIVLSGKVTVAKENAAGNRVIMAVFGPGELFGEIMAFAGNRIWLVTVAAQEACEVLLLPPERIVGNCPRQCPSHHTLIVNTLRIVSERALLLNKKVDYLSMKSIRQKLGSYLHEQYEKTGQTTFMLPMNRNDLADFLNLARPSLSRELCRMRDEGMIDFQRASIKIKDLKALQDSTLGGECGDSSDA
jgi:CRP/FNR family transcriptional regulator, dissimilatory nitrate respiration regulator